MSPEFRCSQASEDRQEPLGGTASTVRAFLLVEAPGPWGEDALRENRLPDLAMRRLIGEALRHRVRPLMIRRHGRSVPDRLSVFAAYADPQRPWVEATSVADPLKILGIDLARLGSGRSPGLTEHPSPLFLVCTHGRHDPCCAERGRPIAAALSQRLPLDTWEVSHIGGDRFAGNLLVLPEGLYYGRLTRHTAAQLAEHHRAGHLDLDHLRGRCGYPFAVQAAEIFLRRELARTETGALALSSRTRIGDQTEVVFTVDERSWLVLVRSTVEPSEQLTCRALRRDRASAHTLVEIRPR